MEPRVRAAALTNYFEVARFVGLDPLKMLRRAGIDPAILADIDNPLPTGRVARLLEESASRSGCSSFGLLLAETRNVASIGAISLLLAQQANARGVVDAFLQYRQLLAEAFLFGIEDAGDTTIIHIDITLGLAGRQGVELLMGIFCRAISEVVGGRWHPESVHFTHSAPLDRSVHHRVFQCRLAFESEFNGLVCPTAALDSPNPAADSTMARHARRYLDMLLPDPTTGSVTERARRSLYLLVPAGRATLDQAAANLDLHPRTLQRLLEKEGRSFGALLNEVRRELALRYLSSPAHSITAIGQMTGYAMPSSFTRWFAAEFGTSPAQWRAEARGEREQRALDLVPAPAT